MAETGHRSFRCSATGVRLPLEVRQLWPEHLRALPLGERHAAVRFIAPSWEYNGVPEQLQNEGCPDIYLSRKVYNLLMSLIKGSGSPAAVVRIYRSQQKVKAATAATSSTAASRRCACEAPGSTVEVPAQQVSGCLTLCAALN